jgi:hypothetical protein
MHAAFRAPRTPDQEKIKDLETELYLARHAIINLMARQKRDILMSFYRCESRTETYAWKQTIAEKLVGTAEVISFGSSKRAYCPLCGDGSSSGHEPRYSLPLGLTRHLTGWGRSRECTVVAAALALARDYWNREFSPAERERDAKKTELLATRRASERLFAIGPSKSPYLSDEGLAGGAPRTEEEATWAEQRLSGLGFRTVVVDRVVSYIDEHEQYVVYADPRAKGGINFAAYLRQAPKKAGAKAKLRAIGAYRIPDTWKVNLAEKYQKWVSEATSTIGGSPVRR